MSRSASRRETEKVFLPIFRNMVLNVRKELAAKYDVKDGDNENYTGLCDVAAEIITERVIECAKVYHIDIDVKIVHGEIAHNSRCLSRYWVCQHTWVEATFPNKTKFYLDATMSQFSDILPAIPDWCSTTYDYHWFYADNDNPRWNGLIKRLVHKNRKLDRLYDRFIVYIQYHIWGWICDQL